MGPSSHATCRASGTPTTSCTGSRNTGACCSAATNPTRWPGGSTARRGSTAGARSRPTSVGSSSCCAARPAVPVPLGCRDREARLPSGRDDAGREPAPRPDPGIRGFFMAAGLSLNGFGGAGGIGRAIAEWVTRGETELDMTPYRSWRFGRVHRDPACAAELAREAYKYYYLLRYPFDQDEWARPKSSALSRLQELGCVFGVKNGWERPDYSSPASRRGVPAPTSARSDGRRRLVRRARRRGAPRVPRARRDRRPSSFGKIEVGGRARSRCSSVWRQLDRPDPARRSSTRSSSSGGAGSSPMSPSHASARIGSGRHRLRNVDADLGWLRSNLRDEERRFSSARRARTSR